jgi:hypothetical protein
MGIKWYEGEKAFSLVKPYLDRLRAGERVFETKDPSYLSRLLRGTLRALKRKGDTRYLDFHDAKVLQRNGCVEVIPRRDFEERIRFRITGVKKDQVANVSRETKEYEYSSWYHLVSFIISGRSLQGLRMMLRGPLLSDNEVEKFKIVCDNYGFSILEVRKTAFEHFFLLERGENPLSGGSCENRENIGKDLARNGG